MSTFLGHATPAQAYWYFEAAPVLLIQVSAATGRLRSGERGDDRSRTTADGLSGDALKGRPESAGPCEDRGLAPTSYSTSLFSV